MTRSVYLIGAAVVLGTAFLLLVAHGAGAHDGCDKTPTNFSVFCNHNVTTNTSDAVDVDVDASGDFLAAWSGDNSSLVGNTLLFARSQDSGSSWTVTKVTDDPVESARSNERVVDLEVLSDDVYLIAFEEQDTDDYEVFKTTDAGQSWSNVLDFDTGMFSGPELVALNESTAMGFWGTSSTESSAAYFQTVTEDAGETWTTQGIGTSSDQAGFMDSVALSGGQVGLAWEDGSGTQDAVRFSRLDVDGLVEDVEVSSTTTSTGIGVGSHEDRVLVTYTDDVSPCDETSFPNCAFQARSTDRGSSWSTSMFAGNARFVAGQHGVVGIDAERWIVGNQDDGTVRLSQTEDFGDNWVFRNQTVSVNETGDEPSQSSAGFMVDENWFMGIPGVSVLQSAEVVDPPPVVEPPEPVDFADGIQDAAAAWGFRTSESQMFFAIAWIGITTVGVGVGTKLMSSGRTKNALIAGSALVVGVFFVFVEMLRFWQLATAAILAGFTIFGGPREVKNTWQEASRDLVNVDHVLAQGGGDEETQRVPVDEAPETPEAPDAPEGAEAGDDAAEPAGGLEVTGAVPEPDLSPVTGEGATFVSDGGDE